MVCRIFVEKRPGLDNEARGLASDINELLQIESVKKVRLFNRYDVDNMTKELFDYSVNTVFSEPQLDVVTEELPEADAVFAVEYLPGQFDQRASSAAECIQIISRGERPAVRTAKVYALYGNCLLYTSVIPAAVFYGCRRPLQILLTWLRKAPAEFGGA